MKLESTNSGKLYKRKHVWLEQNTSSKKVSKNRQRNCGSSIMLQITLVDSECGLKRETQRCENTLSKKTAIISDLGKQ